MSSPHHPRAAQEKLLVTGVDELVGANLAACLADRFEVVGLPRRRYAAVPGCRTVVCRFDQPAALCQTVRRERPQWIVHCGAWSGSSWDQPAARLAAGDEAATSAALAGVAAAGGAQLTVLSSDAVFSGPWLFHDEQAPPRGARGDAAAVRRMERALEGTHALVVRTHAYGWSPAGAEPSWAERAWQALVEGTPLSLDPEQHATPILVTDLAELLCEAYGRRLGGLLHLAGSERASPQRFAGQLAQAFRLPGMHAPPAADAWAAGRRPRLPETSLDTRRARTELRRPMPTLRAGLDRFAAQLHSGYRARLRWAGTMVKLVA